MNELEKRLARAESAAKELRQQRQEQERQLAALEKKARGENPTYGQLLDVVYDLVARIQILEVSCDKE